MSMLCVSQQGPTEPSLAALGLRSISIRIIFEAKSGSLSTFDCTNHNLRRYLTWALVPDISSQYAKLSGTA